MNYFLGYFPDQKTNQQLRMVMGKVGSIFDGQSIPVRWVKPENFHVSVLFVGNDIGFAKKKLIAMRLKRTEIPSFEITFDNVQLGISRMHKGLIYVGIGEGGDKLRDLLFDLRKKLKHQDRGRYVPHLTLGRVSKDLLPQESSNIRRDLKTINKEMSLEKLGISADRLRFVEGGEEEFKMLN